MNNMLNNILDTLQPLHSSLRTQLLEGTINLVDKHCDQLINRLIKLTIDNRCDDSVHTLLSATQLIKDYITDHDEVTTKTLNDYVGQLEHDLENIGVTTFWYGITTTVITLYELQKLAVALQHRSRPQRNTIRTLTQLCLELCKYEPMYHDPSKYEHDIITTLFK